MFQGIITFVVPILANVLAIVLVALIIWQKKDEVIQSVLDDVGGQLDEIFGNPTIKKAYTILGKQSGEVRADNALREKAADGLVDQLPAIGIVLEKIGLSPMEGLRLYNDPMFGPIIQNMISGFMKNKSKGLSGNLPTFQGVSSGSEMSPPQVRLD